LKNELKIQNYELRIEEQEIAPYLDLPESFEKYVESLEYKNRRELRRKMNRLEKEVGNDHWSFRSTEGGKITRDDFQDFVRLVKLSENEKEKFMTGEMEEFFWDLVNIGRDKNNIVGVDLRVDPQKVADKPGGLSLQKDGWQPLLNFFTINNKNAACILTFENGTESLAYNSGYDPEFLFFSPGFLSQAFKIKQLIEKSYKKYDFLRGKERYKYDLGAKEEKLYKIIISV
jgi:CelD/BcsL family acetyltransferase involved in cellulose biosynthesis